LCIFIFVVRANKRANKKASKRTNKIPGKIPSEKSLKVVAL